MASQDKINVFFIIKPERAAGAEMVLASGRGPAEPGALPGLCRAAHPGPGKPPAARTSPPSTSTCPGSTAGSGCAFFLHLCWVLLRYRIQIIHTNSYVPGNYARLAAALMRVPVIIDHWHGFTRFSRKRSSSAACWEGSPT